MAAAATATVAAATAVLVGHEASTTVLIAAADIDSAEVMASARAREADTEPVEALAKKPQTSSQTGVDRKSATMAVERLAKVAEHISKSASRRSKRIAKKIGPSEIKELRGGRSSGRF